jgi:hypothetical protein
MPETMPLLTEGIIDQRIIPLTVEELSLLILEAEFSHDSDEVLFAQV